MQQYHILLQQGQLHPNPQEQFVTNIIKFIQQWQCMHNVLVCLDSNDTAIQSDNHGLDCILEAINLLNLLHSYQFPKNTPAPATHNQGSKTIDYCLGTQEFVQALPSAWILPFGLPLMLTSDHHTLGLEFDHDIHSRQKVPPNQIGYQCGMYSNAYPMVQQFNDTVAAVCKHQNLFYNTQCLALKYQFTSADHTKFEHIDAAITTILVKADHKYAKYCNSPWSIKLHQAFLHHCYWMTQLTQARTKCDHSAILKSIASKLLYHPPHKAH